MNDEKLVKVKIVELPSTQLKSGLKAFQLVDEDTGEKGGLIDEGVTIGENVWIDLDCQVLSFNDSRVYLEKNVVLRGKSKVMAYRSDVIISDCLIEGSTVSLNTTRKDRKQNGLRKLTLTHWEISKTNVIFQHVTGTISHVKANGVWTQDRAYFNINDNTVDGNDAPTMVDIKRLFLGKGYRCTFNIRHALIINGLSAINPNQSSGGNLKFSARSLMIENFTHRDDIPFNFNYGPIKGAVILENCSVSSSNRINTSAREYQVKGSTTNKIFNERNDWNEWAT